MWTLLVSLAVSVSADGPCPDSYAQLMHLFGRSVRTLGEWSEARPSKGLDDVLRVIRQARHCAEVSARGDNETLLPKGYDSALIDRHTYHLRIFTGLLDDAEQSLCESVLDRSRIKNIEQRLWRAADAAHQELFAGKAR